MHVSEADFTATPERTVFRRVILGCSLAASSLAAQLAGSTSPGDNGALAFRIMLLPGAMSTMRR